MLCWSITSVYADFIVYASKSVREKVKSDALTDEWKIIRGPSFLPRNALYAKAVYATATLSVSPSVTLVYCVKMAKYIKLLLPSSSIILVFSCQTLWKIVTFHINYVCIMIST